MMKQPARILAFCLLALTTTIVGAMGGYLMRLGKTMSVGAQLHTFYDRVQRIDLQALLETTQRIEAQLAGATPSNDA